MNRLTAYAGRLGVCVSLTALVVACSDDSPAAPTPFVALNQPPLAGTSQSLYSDQACGSSGCYGGTQQSTAENFVLSGPATLTVITLWGVYFPNDDPVPDNFTVIVHANAAGVPGQAVYTETFAPARNATGTLVGSVPMYRYVLQFRTPPALAAGTYWVEIYNNTAGNTSNFAWVRGTLDATAGVAGANSSDNTPGTVWNRPSNTDLAVRIEAF